MKALSFFLAASLAVAGCSLGRRQPASNIYDFGIAVDGAVVAGLGSGIALETRAPPWIDSPALNYRLLYDDPRRLRSYAHSRWAGSPPLLLAQRLRQQLGIATNDGPSTRRCLLRLELLEFTQVFDAPQESRAVLYSQVTLLDLRQRVVDMRTFTSDLRAGSADAPGGVVALVATTDDLGRQLGQWLSNEKNRGTLQGCRSATADDR